MVSPSAKHLHIEFEVVEVVNEVHDGVDTGQCS
jgi:hypothetical protein